MQVFKYNKKGLVFDMMRATLGLIIVLPALFLNQGNIYINIVLGSLSLLFFSFAIYICIRAQIRFILHSDHLQVRNGLLQIEKAVFFRDINKVALHYYSTRKDKKNGWLQLNIRYKNKKLRIDSQINDFSDLVETIIEKMPDDQKAQLELDDTTIDNLQSMGIYVDYESVAA